VKKESRGGSRYTYKTPTVSFCGHKQRGDLHAPQTGGGGEQKSPPVGERKATRECPFVGNRFKTHKSKGSPVGGKGQKPALRETNKSLACSLERHGGNNHPRTIQKTGGRRFALKGPRQHGVPEKSWQGQKGVSDRDEVLEGKKKTN